MCTTSKMRTLFVCLLLLLLAFANAVASLSSRPPLPPSRNHNPLPPTTTEIQIRRRDLQFSEVWNSTVSSITSTLSYFGTQLSYVNDRLIDMRDNTLELISNSTKRIEDYASNLYTSTKENITSGVNIFIYGAAASVGVLFVMFVCGTVITNRYCSGGNGYSKLGGGKH
jgi:hypothetical protein